MSATKLPNRDVPVPACDLLLAKTAFTTEFLRCQVSCRPKLIVEKMYDSEGGWDGRTVVEVTRHQV